MKLVESHLSDRANQRVDDGSSHRKANSRDNSWEMIFAEIGVHINRVNSHCYQWKMQQVEESAC